MSNQDSGDNEVIGRRGRVVALCLAVLVTAVTVAAVAAPAGAKPDKDRPSHASGPNAETSDASPTDDPTSVEAEPSLRRAALRLVVRTTSDWAQVDLPGISAGHVVASNPDGAESLPTSRGVVIRGAARVDKTIVVDVVTEVPAAFEQGHVRLTQGSVGKTTVRIRNITGDPYTAAKVTTNGSTTTQSVGVGADALMGAEQLEWVRADDERRVLAFTYPWFDDWATTDPRLSVHPTDPWNVVGGDDALAMAELARANGIDGFVMSFAGGASNGLPLYHSLRAAEQTGGTATILLETSAAGSPAVAEQWLREALRQSGSPAFLRLDGVPVVFAFAAGKVSVADWAAISDRLAAEGTPVHIVGDDWQGVEGPHAGHYRYNSLLHTPDDPMTTSELVGWNRAISRGLRAAATLGSGEPDLVVATAQPGWDDHLIRGDDRLVIDRDGTATYDGTWQAALAGEPDWVVITSWNEWYEGTGIAPSLEHGMTALEATARWAERFAG